MKSKNIFRNIYYILLISIILGIVLYQLGFFHWFVKDQPELGNIDELTESSEEDEKKKKRRHFNFDTSSEDRFKLKEGDFEDDRSKIVDYKSFKEIALTKDFVEMFRDSLIESYTKKKEIYRKMLNTLRSEVPKTNGLNFDSNKVRKEKEIAEVEEILTVLDKRVKEISLEKIRNDFKDIIANQTNGFDSLIGRDDVKDMLAQRIYTFAKNPLVFLKGFQNVAIYGSSGVGKTKTAQTIGYIYAKTGILIRRKFRVVSKQEFTSPYIDESASLTRGLVLSCLEGVLFIDEAYGLTPGSFNPMGGNNHKDEAITELVNALEIYKGLGVVMAGGYENLMEKNFMTSNEGMRRRFPNIIRLDNYNSSQLTDILISFINESAPDIIITEADANILYKAVDTLNEKSILTKQAGDMQNLAATITTAMYSSYMMWGHYDDNLEILKAGTNAFLKNKGLSYRI